MNPEQIRAFEIEATEEVFVKQNVDAIDKYLAKDFVNHNPAHPTVCNREDYKQWIRNLAKAFPNSICATIDEVLVEGDKYAARWTLNCTGGGEFLGVDVTGKKATVIGMTVIRLENDKIAEQWWGYDMLGFLQQLGMIPQPGQAAKA
jgi:steroid delta-isomerase-like uncharacterized protein